MDKLTAIKSFVVVAHKGGFAAAARQLGVTSSILTRRISGLEESLGTTLLLRNTRRVVLTAAGETYLVRCREILAAVETADLELAESSTLAVGRLRVQLPLVFARLRVMPRLGAFLDKYPNLELFITQSDGTQHDLIGKGLDVAVWNGHLADSALVARRLTGNYRITCASRAYIERHGLPETIEDLKQHNCLRAEVYHGGRSWMFQTSEGEHLVPVSGNLVFDNSDNYRAAVLAGLGIGQSASMLFESDVRLGRLQQVLEPFVAEGQTLYAVYPRSHMRSPKIRAFVDFLADVATKDLAADD